MRSLFTDQTLPVSKMLNRHFSFDSIRAAECAWRLAQLLDPTTPEDAVHQSTLLLLATDRLDRAAKEGDLKPEHQELRRKIEDQLKLLQHS